MCATVLENAKLYCAMKWISSECTDVKTKTQTETMNISTISDEECEDSINLIAFQMSSKWAKSAPGKQLSEM